MAVDLIRALGQDHDPGIVHAPEVRNIETGAVNFAITTADTKRQMNRVMFSKLVTNRCIFFLDTCVFQMRKKKSS